MAAAAVPAVPAAGVGTGVRAGAHRLGHSDRRHRGARPEASASASRAKGLRIVGIAAATAAGVIAVLAGLAVIQAMLAAGQVRLSGLEADIATERERLIALQVELETLRGPAKVEQMGNGVMGLMTAADPIDIRLMPRHIAVAHTHSPSIDDGGNWLAIKTLLTDASTAHDRRN